jgi:uncharacterized protein YqjF (DUF2071 family)
MPRIFLTARWLNLVLVNYRVPPALLEPHVPPGSQLDTPNDAPDLHLLSLVAFHFADTRAYGIPIPTGQWFPELNLRFYVRKEEKRATVFLREFVPSALIALGARLLYHQPYYLALIDHQIRHSANNDTIDINTHFRFRQHTGKLHVRARNAPFIPAPESQEHFLKEHYWGFDRKPGGNSFRYRVDHPVWRTYPVEEAQINFDPGALLGPPWQQIDWNKALHSVLFAEGSAVEVFTAEPL